MPLTIETGAGIVGANSYATVEEARAYATARGLTLPATDGPVEAALVLACDKLETYRYRGAKTAADQALMWPRAEAYLDGAYDAVATDYIPAQLKFAQCQFAVESANGADLQPTGSGREVIEKTVDVLTTKYAPTGAGTVTPQFNKAEAILAPLLASAAFGLSTLRV